MAVQRTVSLSKADVRRALVRHHFSPCADQMSAFDRLRSIQFDPIAPVGCNHDLVLQARVSGYRIGDWNKTAYEDRKIYDGWDKQASLIPLEGWPLRRIFHAKHSTQFDHIFRDYADAVDSILKEIEKRGPLMPKDLEFQARNQEWKDSWHGPNVSKQTLRALWHSGRVMTAGRKNGQHLYDLTERVIPSHLFSQPLLSEKDAIRELVYERHLAMGILRPTAPYEVWSFNVLTSGRKDAIPELVETGRIIPVDVEGVKAHATPEFLALLDLPSLEPGVVFVAPLDQFVWDRKMIAHLFDFDYVWEIYTPVVKRRWGYYVLPILFGDALVARVEFWCRDGVLEIREWHSESADTVPDFREALAQALREFMAYCSATSIRVTKDIDPKIRELVESIRL